MPGLTWPAGAAEPFIVSSEQRTLIGLYARSEDADQSDSDAVTVAELDAIGWFQENQLAGLRLAHDSYLAMFTEALAGR
jgi:hypothetical protein